MEDVIPFDIMVLYSSPSTKPPQKCGYEEGFYTRISHPAAIKYPVTQIPKYTVGINTRVESKPSADSTHCTNGKSIF